MLILSKVFRSVVTNTFNRFSLTNGRQCFNEATRPTMRYLNVAEKNDAAKSIANLLSNGAARRSEGLSTFNKLYSFHTMFRGQPADMVMTSVSGHLMEQDFNDAYRQWHSVDPIALFDAPIVKICPERFIKIKQTIEREVNNGNISRSWLCVYAGFLWNSLDFLSLTAV